ncbi:MAG: sigma-70 family RNA polymerase sigma factor [Eubacterium sp.]|nr:sigma-70 family RNA polymerase sigma factor [Eubacterium sp.]
MTNETIAVYLKEHPSDTNAQEQLFNNINKYTAMYIDKNFAGRDKEELTQESYFAMMDATKDYDPQKGKFLTHYTWKLKAHLQRYIIYNMETVRRSSHADENMKKYSRIYAERIKAGQDTKSTTMARVMNVSVEVVKNIKKTSVWVNSVSADMGIKSTDEDITLLEILPSKQNVENEVIEQIARQELKRDLWEFVDELQEIQSKVLHGYFEDGLTFKELSDKYNVKYNKIIQKKNEALQRLEQNQRLYNKLQPYIQEIRSAALRGNGVDRFRRTGTSSTEYTAMKRVESLNVREQILTEIEELKQYQSVLKTY